MVQMTRNFMAAAAGMILLAFAFPPDVTGVSELEYVVVERKDLSDQLEAALY